MAEHNLIRKVGRLSLDELRALRNSLALSQGGLGRLLGVKALTIGRWERSESAIPIAAEAIVRRLAAEDDGYKPNMALLVRLIASPPMTKDSR